MTKSSWLGHLGRSSSYAEGDRPGVLFQCFIASLFFTYHLPFARAMGRLYTKRNLSSEDLVMRPTEYEERKKIKPGQMTSKARYAMNSLKSHRRPLPTIPLSARPDDSPATRGVTKDEE